MHESLLPTNTTAFEQQLEKALRLPDFSINIIRSMFDPWTIPEKYLPWLAQRFGVKIWNNDWSVERKRSVISNNIELVRAEGTEKGLRDYVELADGEVKQVVVPPQHFWAAKGLTKEEIDAWHRTMPQIRVYFAHKRESAKGFSFANQVINKIVATPDIGRALYGRKARLWEGKERELNFINFKTTDAAGRGIVAERVSLPGKAGQTFYAGGFVNTSCEAVIKKPQLLTWNKNIKYTYQTINISTTSLRPGLTPIDLRSEQVSDQWQDSYSFTVSRVASRFFAVPNKAQEKLFDRLVLNDPKRAAPRIKAMSFTDTNMLTMPAFTARLLIDLKERHHEKDFYADVSAADLQITTPNNLTKQQSVDRAVILSKAARDRIYISYQTSRPIRFADTIPVDGSVKFNSRVENRL